MSQNLTEATPLTLIVLTEWDRRAPEFLEQVDAFESANTSRLIKEQFDTFRSALGNGEQPDFSKFQTDCRTIFSANLPSFQIPPMMDYFKQFFIAFLGAALLVVIGGLIAIALAEITAWIGLITIATVNSTLLCTLSAGIGGTIGVLASVSMFRPATVASNALDDFSNQVTQKPEAATTTAGMTNA